jgi:co-chaperonin GroES (HSP10)
MTTSLYLPEHVANRLRAKGKAPQTPEEPKPSAVEKAYVDPDNRVLDPSLLDVSLLDRLPQPTGWRVLVMPYQAAAKTKGGVFVPDDVRAKETVATVVAYVLRVGPLAYKDPSKFGSSNAPWCKQGDWVCIGRYAGSRFKIDGGEVRILNDDEIIATILDPTDIVSV